MIAVDTNILVCAHRQEMPEHQRALDCIQELAEGDERWGIPVFCVGEFIRVTTHRAILNPPSTLTEAWAVIDRVLAAPTVRLLQPGSRYVSLLRSCLEEGDARGNLVFDAQIAALCLEHGATDLITLDRDFARFRRINHRPPGHVTGDNLA